MGGSGGGSGVGGGGRVGGVNVKFWTFAGRGLPKLNRCEQWGKSSNFGHFMRTL